MSESKTTAPYPHEGACPDCQREKRCNYCSLRSDDRCTNGRCRACHALICTPGGATSPGHGFGNQGGRHFT